MPVKIPRCAGQLTTETHPALNANSARVDMPRARGSEHKQTLPRQVWNRVFTFSSSVRMVTLSSHWGSDSFSLWSGGKSAFGGRFCFFQSCMIYTHTYIIKIVIYRPKNIIQYKSEFNVLERYEFLTGKRMAAFLFRSPILGI